MPSSLLINGGKTRSFKPKKGLRQGDPLSPSLFILCQEVLARMLDREFLEGRISGVKASPNGPTLTHVMYADDIVLFSKADSREASSLNNCLEKYCTWSGQQINRAKSGLAFSKASSKPAMQGVKQLLQMKSLNRETKYLGAPMFLKKSRTKDFHFLEEQLEAKLKGWRSKCLSWAGRCTLIKSVAQAIPSYTMSTFEVPSKTCNNLDSLIRRF